MKLKNKNYAFKITLLGLSLALYIVLSIASVNLGFIKISLTGIPLIFISVIYGPIEGMFVGLTGEFICQVFQYGFTPTTALWLLPPVVRALIIGLMFKQKNPRNHMVFWIISIILSSLAVTVLNTFNIYIDALVMEYPSGLTDLTILFRFIGSIVSSIIYAIIVPTLFAPLIKQGKFETEKGSD